MVATAAIGGALVTGVMGANAASDAANTQANAATQASNNQLAATQQSNALQYALYQQGLQQQSPYLQGGQIGESALLGALGLGGNNPSLAGSGSNTTTYPTATTGGAANLPGIAGQLGGVAGQIQRSQGAPTNPDGTQSAITAATPTSTNIPGIGQVGGTNYGASQGQLNNAAGAFQGQLAHQFNNNDLNSQLAPNYQFQLGQGLQALKASMAATGSLQTGQGLKNINDYAQNYAGNAYQNAFNNYTTQQNNLYTRLQGLISPGSAAAGNVQSAAGQVGSGIAGTTQAGTAASNNYLTGGAAAQAAGQVGGVNAITGAFNNGLNGYLGAGLYNKYINSNPGTSGDTPGYFGGLNPGGGTPSTSYGLI